MDSRGQNGQITLWTFAFVKKRTSFFSFLLCDVGEPRSRFVYNKAAEIGIEINRSMNVKFWQIDVSGLSSRRPIIESGILLAINTLELNKLVKQIMPETRSTTNEYVQVILLLHHF